VKQSSSSKPIHRNGVTSLLSFSEMEYNDGASACTGHADSTTGLTSATLFY